MFLRLLMGVPFLLCLKLHASGAWYQTPQQITQSQKSSFTPEFSILKLGVFSAQGHFTLSSQAKEPALKRYCSSKTSETIAWVTHKLSPKETLTEMAGKTLGTQLARVLEGSCFSAVELDIEQLIQAEVWLEGFLRAVRSNLPEKIKLRLAIPILSPHSVPGRFWTLQDGVKAIQWVDGLDVMAYDSGVKTAKEYGELFKNTFFFVMELPKQTPGRDVIVGLPAYQDKTSLHTDEKENLEIVLTTLKQFTPFQMKPFCSGEIRLAYYAGWTLSNKDREVHRQLGEWKNEICKKAK